jgi:hypothetical protein
MMAAAVSRSDLRPYLATCPSSMVDIWRAYVRGVSGASIHFVLAAVCHRTASLAARARRARVYVTRFQFLSVGRLRLSSQAICR